MTPQNRPAGARLAFASDFPLIVHSHLRWDFVWQRPQQLLSRMAATAPVLFVEEPIPLDDVRGERAGGTAPGAPPAAAAVARGPDGPGAVRRRADPARRRARRAAGDHGAGAQRVPRGAAA